MIQQLLRHSIHVSILESQVSAMIKEDVLDSNYVIGGVWKLFGSIV